VIEMVSYLVYPMDSDWAMRNRSLPVPVDLDVWRGKGRPGPAIHDMDKQGTLATGLMELA
jgi:hypothetical protein